VIHLGTLGNARKRKREENEPTSINKEEQTLPLAITKADSDGHIDKMIKQ